ncbi:membrane protein [Streptomyces cinereoruber]|uniref:ABC transporter permease n=1 Tax=Streptomyces cinereoruber TaxID=67260 RepID=A0AAV4KLB0_9ACTN|nr:ABC transporter permease [Streptomyces cinereoruber]MBB4159703.1 ABC-2 type transport system permease protein [Streptomyces cinereoruber]MBY8817929.1 ABC transporter permease [Streptomyces cinereoruber]NIH60411.1 ABC-2 type transport system permease protein [Streptomyces cinereoruber]QEV33809.1 ABC transporter permease [Streptomyces cinereoruber]GGR33287.1 membrane protein [Streptomyces cinereoruber]
MSTQIPQPSQAAPDTTRIHNIGYRSYDGPRLGRAYARRSLFSQSLRGAYGLGRSAKSKVLPMLLAGVMCAPALIIVAVAVATQQTKLSIEYTQYAIYLQVVIGIFLASQAPQSVSRDLRFRTVPLYFSRPIERADYVLAKYGAMASALFILTAVPLLIMWIGSMLAKMDFAEQTKMFGQGLVSVALLSLLFGGIGLVMAALTPRRGFGVAAVIGVLTISYGAVSTLMGIAYVTENAGAIKWLGLFSPITLIDGVQTAFLGAPSMFPELGGPGAGFGVVYLLAVLALIAGSYGILMRRYRKVGP